MNNTEHDVFCLLSILRKEFRACNSSKLVLITLLVSFVNFPGFSQVIDRASIISEGPELSMVIGLEDQVISTPLTKDLYTSDKALLASLEGDLLKNLNSSTAGTKSDDYDYESYALLESSAINSNPEKINSTSNSIISADLSLELPAANDLAVNSFNNLDDGGNGLIDCNDPACQALFACQDLDNDGVNNLDDLDDDNDGLYDSVECELEEGVSYTVTPDGTSSTGMVTTASGLTANYSTVNTILQGFTDIEFLSNNNGVEMKHITGDYGNPDQFGNIITVTPQAGAVVGSFSLFQVVENYENLLLANHPSLMTLTWDNTVHATLHDPDNQILNLADGDMVTSGAEFEFTEIFNEFSTWRIEFHTLGLNGPFNLDLVYTGINVDLVNEWLAFSTALVKDTDHDGLADCMDSDSDNDGCFDVIESGGVDANSDGYLDGTGISTDGLVTGNTGGYNGKDGSEVIAGILEYNENLADLLIEECLSAVFEIKPAGFSTEDFINGSPIYTILPNTSELVEYQWYFGDPLNGEEILDTNQDFSGSNSGSLSVLNIEAYNNQEFCVSMVHPNNNCDTIVDCGVLYVLQPISIENELVICDGETATINGMNYSTAQEVVNVYSSVQGCDSTVTTDVIVNPVFTFEDAVTICDGETATINGMDYTEAQDVIDIYASVLGCDSTITTTIIVNPVATFEETIIICEGETATVNGVDYLTSQEVVNLYPTGNECDSVVTTLIVVNPLVTFEETVTICEGETAMINGMDYTTNQEVINVYQSALGCDSTVITNLIVYPLQFITNELSICEGTSHTEGNSIYTEAGTYTDIYETINGCDSTVTTILSINSQFEVTNEIALCEGEEHIEGTNIYNTTGTYLDTYTSSLGCDSLVTTNLTINPLVTFEDEVTICEGETVTINGMDYTTAQEVVNVYESALGCDSTVTINISVNPLVTFSEIVTICEGETVTINGIDYTAAQEVVNVYESALGCDSIVTTDVIVNPVIEFEETFSICEGDSITVNNMNYSTSEELINVYPSALGCDSIVTTIITVLPQIIVEETVIICDGDGIIINGEEYFEPQEVINVYTTVIGCDSTIITTIDVTSEVVFEEVVEICEGETAIINGSEYTESQEIINVYETVNGCDSTVTTVLTINSVVETEILEMVCEGEPIPEFGPFFDEPNNRFIDTLQTVVGCDSIVYTYLEFINLETLLPTEISLCSGDSYEANLDGIDENWSLIWSTGSTNSSESFSSEGIYWVQLISENCNSTDSIHIIVENPLILESENLTVCSNKDLVLDLTGSDGQITWNDGSEQHTFIIQESGIYSAQVVNSCGTYEYIVSVEEEDCSCNIHIPNAITANGDNLNDAFTVEHTCDFIKYELTISNRWGSIIFKTNDPSESWIGNQLGGNFYVPNGVYSYSLLYTTKDINNNQVTAKRYGSVTIVR